MRRLVTKMYFPVSLFHPRPWGDFLYRIIQVRSSDLQEDLTTMTNSTGPRTEEAASADMSTLYAVDGKAPGYKDTETMETAFRGVYKDYIKSSGAIELKKALEHMKGQISSMWSMSVPTSADSSALKSSTTLCLSTIIGVWSSR